MRADLRRLCIALAIVACAAIPVWHASAFSNDDVIVVDFNQNTENLICKSQGILDGLNALRNGYLRQLVTDTINELKSLVTAYAFQLLLCSIIPDKVVHVGALGIGGDVIFKSPNCPMDLGGATAAVIKRNTLDKIKNDFTARCLANGVRTRMGDDIRRIIQENGPDGGPAYVTDWTALYADEDARAINRFNAVLVNTDICPYFRDYVYQYFGVPQSYIDDPPALTGLGLRVDGGDSFNQRAACGLPDNFTPASFDRNFLPMGGFATMEALLQPENNPNGFIRMAEDELAKQRAIVVSAAVNDAVAGGGFRSSSGDSQESCINMDPNGKCLAFAPIKQPSGALRDANAAAVQSEFDWVVSSNEMNTLMGDVGSRLAGMIYDLGAKTLDYDVEFSGGAQDYIDIGTGVKPPEEVLLPTVPGSGGSGDPGDLECTGGNPDCVCVRNAPELFPIRDQLAEATRAAILQHPELVSGGSVLPGMERLFLIAVCETSIGQQWGCHPNGDSEDEIVIETSTSTLSIDIIASSGAIRIPGQTVALCRAGVQ